MAYNNGSFSGARVFQNKKITPFQSQHYSKNTNSTMILGDSENELSFSSMTQSKPTTNHRDDDNDNTAVYEEETTLDMGTIGTLTTKTNGTSSNIDTPLTMMDDEEDTMYDDDMDDMDDYVDIADDDEEDDEEELDTARSSKALITPLPDEYGDYDDNYDDHYEDVNYAAAPPKKKKYRESDASINGLRYDDAVKQRSAEIKDKHQKRYSKYDSDFYSDYGHDPNDSNISSDFKENSKLVSTYSNRSNRTNGGRGGIELSVTKEIDEHSDASEYAKEMSKKELSLYFNKKTQDKYDKFEMNTYSSDSTEDSGVIKNKYLKDPLTPGPDLLYDSDHDMDADDVVDPFSTNSKNPSHATQIKMNFSKKDNTLSPLPQKPPNINKDASDLDHRKHGLKKKNKKFKNGKKESKKKKITLKEFMTVDLERFVRDNDSDNFDVAKAVCKFYDDLCQDTDTVTIVADKGKGPNTAYWSKGDYNRVEKDCLGKYIMVYRACKHVEAKIKVKQDIFESCVKGLCMDNLGHSQLIADKLDCVFGEGCHVSLASHDDFEVFCRYSDGYICEVELPNDKDFVVAWRR